LNFELYIQFLQKQYNNGGLCGIRLGLMNLVGLTSLAQRS